jgi:hypothetical protein
MLQYLSELHRTSRVQEHVSHRLVALSSGIYLCLMLVFVAVWLGWGHVYSKNTTFVL